MLRDLRDRAPGPRLCDFGGLIFDNDLERTSLKLTNDIACQFCDAGFPGVSDQTNRFRAHTKNSWLPSVPTIADGDRPMTSFLPDSIDDAILRFAFSCSEGSRTIPPRQTSARSNSNCGLIKASTIPLALIN